MGSPRRTREALARARAELEAAEAEADAYERPEAREQRELARAEHCWRFVRERLTPALCDQLAQLAEPEGEGWLFAREVLEADDHRVHEGRPG